MCQKNDGSVILSHLRLRCVGRDCTPPKRDCRRDAAGGMNPALHLTPVVPVGVPPWRTRFAGLSVFGPASFGKSPKPRPPRRTLRCCIGRSAVQRRWGIKTQRPDSYRRPSENPLLAPPGPRETNIPHAQPGLEFGRSNRGWRAETRSCLPELLLPASCGLPAGLRPAIPGSG